MPGKYEGKKSTRPIYHAHKGGKSLSVWAENAVIEQRRPKEKDSKEWISVGKVYFNVHDLKWLKDEVEIAIKKMEEA